MQELSREERIANVKANILNGIEGERTIMEDNIMDIDVLAEQVLRIEDLYYKFKNDCIPSELLRETIGSTSFTPPQSAQSIRTLMGCIDSVEKMDKAVTNAIPALATINAIALKERELKELKEALDA